MYKLIKEFSRYKNPLFILLLLLTLGACQTSTENELSTASKSPQVITFSLAEPSEGMRPRYFTLFFKDNTLVTWENHDTDLYGIKWQDLDLGQFLAEEDQYIEHLVYAVYDNDLIIVFVISNGDFAGSSVARIDGKTLQPKWKSDFYGFNIGQPIIRGKSLYLSSFGAIGKIDIDTGEFFWKHVDLYNWETDDFNSFKMPIFSESKVIFQDTNYRIPCPKRIEVNDDDGSILEIVETCVQ